MSHSDEQHEIVDDSELTSRLLHQMRTLVTMDVASVASSFQDQEEQRMIVLEQIWDSTADKDTAAFYVENHVLDVLLLLLTRQKESEQEAPEAEAELYHSNRILELACGILANICIQIPSITVDMLSVSSEEPTTPVKLLASLLQLFMTSMDSCILNECIRCIQAASSNPSSAASALSLFESNADIWQHLLDIWYCTLNFDLSNKCMELLFSLCFNSESMGEARFVTTLCTSEISYAIPDQGEEEAGDEEGETGTAAFNGLIELITDRLTVYQTQGKETLIRSALAILEVLSASSSQDVISRALSSDALHSRLIALVMWCEDDDQAMGSLLSCMSNFALECNGSNIRRLLRQEPFNLTSILTTMSRLDLMSEFDKEGQSEEAGGSGVLTSNTFGCGCFVLDSALAEWTNSAALMGSINATSPICLSVRDSESTLRGILSELKGNGFCSDKDNKRAQEATNAMISISKHCVQILQAVASKEPEMAGQPASTKSANRIQQAYEDLQRRM